MGFILLAGVTSLVDWDAGVAANVALGVVVEKKGDICRQHAHSVVYTTCPPLKREGVLLQMALAWVHQGL